MKQNDHLIYSYLTLRRAVGWIGILLPFTVMLGDILIFKGKEIHSSISQYYYSGMRDVFVGQICAIALFLFFYRAYDNMDKWSTNLAGIFAVGVAFFPTTENGPGSWVGTVHFVSAAGFFLVLAAISLFLFTRGRSTTARKTVRNKIYVACGFIIVACLLAIFIYFKFFYKDDIESSFVFWTETLALIAFGVSWLTKGGTIYPDEKVKPSSLNLRRSKKVKV